MEIKKPRVLDERKIHFQIEEGVLEVFDQKNNLIGDKPLPIPINENTTSEEIYTIAEQCGYNISDMIASILEESVFENKEYDIWLTNEGVIYYSPSTEEWVSEPYGGIFVWLSEYLTSEEEEVKEEVKDYEETENNSAEENYLVEDQRQDKPLELENETNSNEEDTLEKEKDVLEKEEDIDIQFEESKSAQEIAANKELLYEEKEVLEKEEINITEVEDMNERNNSKLNKSESTQRNTELVDVSNEGILESWIRSYKKVLKSKKTVDGVSLEDLVGIVSDIVLEKISAKSADKEIFTLNQKEVLLELVSRSEVVFEINTVVNAGFFQAYLNLQD